MEAVSSPMVMTGSWVVVPMRQAMPGRNSSPSSSNTMAPEQGPYQGAAASTSAWKPMELPKDIFITASATPPASTAQAAFTLPWRHNWWKESQAVFSSP